MNNTNEMGYLQSLGYDSFGMITVGRSWEVGSEYRYGFNGQEQDDDISGPENLNTAEFWEYDTRLGRRWNLDPVPIPSIGQYVCFNDNPIWFVDPRGDKVKISGEDDEKKTFIDQVNKVTGGNYKINKKGELKAKFGQYGKTVDGKLFKQAIKTKNIIPVNVVSNSDDTYFDSFISTNIDVGDIGMGDETFMKGVYAHIISERLAAGSRYADYESRLADSRYTYFGTTAIQPKFAEYHNQGLIYESRAIGESLNIKNLPIRAQMPINEFIFNPEGGLVATGNKGYEYSYGVDVKFRVNLPLSFIKEPTMQKIISITR